MISRGCCQGNIGSFQSPASVHRPQSSPLISLPPRHESHSGPLPLLPVSSCSEALQLPAEIPAHTHTTSNHIQNTQWLAGDCGGAWRRLFQGQLLSGYNYPLWRRCGRSQLELATVQKLWNVFFCPMLKWTQGRGALPPMSQASFGP